MVSSRADWAELLTLLGIALLVGVYFVIRPATRWAESDTGLMTEAIRIVTSTGHLTPDVLGVYSNGYGYQAVSAAIMAFTGLPASTLQQVVYPLVASLLVLPAWVLYRELTGSGRIASLAVLLLLLVPEHLFAILRGSHERLDRTFLFAAVWLLLRSIHHRHDRVRFAIHIGLMLAMTYCLIATNVLFGMSFVAALTTMVILGVVTARLAASVRPLARRTTALFASTAAAATLLIAVFVAFMYPPVAKSIQALAAIPGGLIDIILNGGASADPYAYVAGAWVNPAAFLLLSIGNVLLLVISAGAWVWLARAWLRGGAPASIGVWVLWLLYASFALQGLAGVVSDRTGALQGNIQYRAFSVFGTMAAPLVALALARWQAGAWRRSLPWMRRASWRRTATVAFVAVAAIATMAKSTLEPTLSNKWLFYSPLELQGLRWADGHLAGTAVWIGPDERLGAAYLTVVGNPAAGNSWTVDESEQTGAYVISDAIRIQASRLGVTMPATGTFPIVYDNGGVHIHRSPGAVLPP